MNLIWGAHIPEPEKREEFLALVRNSTLVLRRVRDILQTKLAALEAEECNQKDFESASWALKQAFLQGRKNEIRQQLSLLDFLK